MTDKKSITPKSFVKSNHDSGRLVFRPDGGATIISGVLYKPSFDKFAFINRLILKNILGASFIGECDKIATLDGLKNDYLHSEEEKQAILDGEWK